MNIKKIFPLIFILVLILILISYSKYLSISNTDIKYDSTKEDLIKEVIHVQSMKAEVIPLANKCQAPIGGNSINIISILSDNSILYYYSDNNSDAKSIYISAENTKNILCNKSPSIPVVSNNKKKIAYIDELEWEIVGNVYLYDVEQKTRKIIISNENLKNSYKPKSLTWLDDRYLMVVIGYAYGTISVGGDLYIYDTLDNSLNLVYEPKGYDEIVDVKVDNDKVIASTAKFNEDMTKYEVEDIVFTDPYSTLLP